MTCLRSVLDTDNLRDGNSSGGGLIPNRQCAPQNHGLIGEQAPTQSRKCKVRSNCAQNQFMPRTNRVYLPASAVAPSFNIARTRNGRPQRRQNQPQSRSLLRPNHHKTRAKPQQRHNRGRHPDTQSLQQFEQRKVARIVRMTRRNFGIDQAEQDSPTTQTRGISRSNTIAATQCLLITRSHDHTITRPKAIRR